MTSNIIIADQIGGKFYGLFNADMLRATAMSFTQARPQRGCLIVLAAPQSTGPHPDICEELKSQRRRMTKLLTARLKRGQRDGDLLDTANCTAIANYYITLQQGMSIQARDGATRRTLLDIAENAMAGWQAVTRSYSDALT